MTQDVSLHSRGLELALDQADALVRAAHHDPFAVLGPHSTDAGHLVRVYLPNALSVELLQRDGGASLGRMEPGQVPGLFVARLDQPTPYRLRIRWAGGEQETEDPYSFGPLLGDLDIYLFSEGNHRDLGHCLGAQPMTIDGVPGVRFALWAPNARRVSVVGPFNNWDGRRHPMRQRHPSGVWELFIPRLEAGEYYKYELLGPDGTLLPLKADPVARATELPPGTSSQVAAPLQHSWQDGDWVCQHRWPGTLELVSWRSRVVDAPVTEQSSTDSVFVSLRGETAAFAVQQSALEYEQVDNVYNPASGYFPLPPWGGFAVLVGWAALAVGLAWSRLRKADV